MILVNEDSVVGKCQFSAILKHAYHQAVTPEIIKQGFRRTGLFPLCRNAVNTSQMVKRGPSRDGSLPGFPSPPPSATSMLSASTAPEEYSACQQLPNPLMPSCIIPESLADVLGFPRFVKLEQTSRCLTLSARGKTSNEGTVALKRKQQRQEKKGKKEMGQKREKRKRSDVPSDTTNQHCIWRTDVAPPQSSDDALIYKMEKVKVVPSSNGSMQETSDILGPSQVSMSNQERRNPPLAIRIKTSAGYSALLKQKKRERKRRKNKDVVKRKREERRQTCTLLDASNSQLGVQCEHVVSPQSSDDVLYRAACLGCDTLSSDHDYAQNENSECSAHMTLK
ncbi:uncharacterized protein LOC134324465 [Trichomycterus rosablanca]|uniref:uncharacterized protein LOC134324465 n=1 Tax=Trichomycterus rosablanca TaxID=2290929 RepID=UPI002F35873F